MRNRLARPRYLERSRRFDSPQTQRRAGGLLVGPERRCGWIRPIDFVASSAGIDIVAQLRDGASVQD
jgi:hypothetical protein